MCVFTLDGDSLLSSLTENDDEEVSHSLGMDVAITGRDCDGDDDGGTDGPYQIRMATWVQNARVTVHMIHRRVDELVAPVLALLRW